VRVQSDPLLPPASRWISARYHHQQRSDSPKQSGQPSRFQTHSGVVRDKSGKKPSRSSSLTMLSPDVSRKRSLEGGPQRQASLVQIITADQTTIMSAGARSASPVQRHNSSEQTAGLLENGLLRGGVPMASTPMLSGSTSSMPAFRTTAFSTPQLSYTSNFSGGSGGIVWNIDGSSIRSDPGYVLSGAHSAVTSAASTPRGRMMARGQPAPTVAAQLPRLRSGVPWVEAEGAEGQTLVKTLQLSQCRSSTSPMLSARTDSTTPRDVPLLGSASTLQLQLSARTNCTTPCDGPGLGSTTPILPPPPNSAAGSSSCSIGGEDRLPQFGAMSSVTINAIPGTPAATAERGLRPNPKVPILQNLPRLQSGVQWAENQGSQLPDAAAVQIATSAPLAQGGEPTMQSLTAGGSHMSSGFSTPLSSLSMPQLQQPPSTQPPSISDSSSQLASGQPQNLTASSRRLAPTQGRVLAAGQLTASTTPAQCGLHRYSPVQASTQPHPAQSERPPEQTPERPKQQPYNSGEKGLPGNVDWQALIATQLARSSQPMPSIQPSAQPSQARPQTSNEQAGITILSSAAAAAFEANLSRDKIRDSRADFQPAQASPATAQPQGLTSPPGSRIFAMPGQSSQLRGLSPPALRQVSPSRTLIGNVEVRNPAVPSLALKAGDSVQGRSSLPMFPQAITPANLWNV